MEKGGNISFLRPAQLQENKENTMADRKATNKYYPPEWEPKHGSINTYRNSHPLRDRAKHLKTEGILIVRFALPFSVWCSKCQVLLGAGTRFNAEKQSIGKLYDDIDVWQFQMKCPSCSNEIRMKTDVEGACYEVTHGAKRRSEAPEREVDDVHRVMTQEQAMKIASDPMFQLETKRSDELQFGAGSDIHKTLGSLQKLQEKNWDNSFDNSYEIRKQHRQMRKHVAQEEQAFDRTYGNVRKDVQLLPMNMQDSSMAQQTTFYRLSKRSARQDEVASTKRNKIAKINRAVNTLRKKNKTSLNKIQTSIMDQIEVNSPLSSTNTVQPTKKAPGRMKEDNQGNKPSSSLALIASNY